MSFGRLSFAYATTDSLPLASVKYTCTKVAIVGTGWMARALGNLIADHENLYEVCFVSRNVDKKSEDGFTYKCPVRSYEDGLRDASIVLLAIPAEAEASLLKNADFRENVSGKIIVSMSNPSDRAVETALTNMLSTNSNDPNGENEADCSKYESAGGDVEEDKPTTPSQKDVKMMRKQTSMGKVLSDALDDVKIVKAFNTISAYALEDGSAGLRIVPVSSDYTAAANMVIDLARTIGLDARYIGPLRFAQKLEAQYAILFTKWKIPLAITLTIIVGYLMGHTFYFYVRKLGSAAGEEEGQTIYADFGTWAHEAIGLRSFGDAALTLMSIMVYLPGLVAGFIQIARGTASRAFPKWFSHYVLGVRKHFGLIAFWLILVHSIIGCATVANSQMNPSSYIGTRDSTIVEDVNGEEMWIGARMNKYGSMKLLFGTVSLALFLLLSITSIPGIGQLLSWREWHFVQSILGYAGLAFGTFHTFLVGYSRLDCENCVHKKDWDNHATEYWPGGMVPGWWVAFGFAFVVLSVKLVMSVPPISTYLSNLRRNK